MQAGSFRSDNPHCNLMLAIGSIAANVMGGGAHGIVDGVKVTIILKSSSLERKKHAISCCLLQDQ